MNKLLLGAVLFIMSCSTVSYLEHRIEDRKLMWKDFSAKPVKDLDYDAYTKWSVYYEYDAPLMIGDTAKLTFKVWRTLSSSESWVRKKTKAEKSQLLEHEQGHYDIAGLCVKELKEVFKKEVFYKDNYHIVIDSIYKTVLNKYIQMEKQYDLETEHLYNREEQRKWDAYFKEHLK